jgi:hypothetical protein
LELFQKQKGYKGEAFYIPAQVVVDNKVIAENETAAVQFAYEIFRILEIDSDEEMELCLLKRYLAIIVQKMK